jgi:riboflavin synthase
MSVFTGIVEELGMVASITRSSAEPSDAARLALRGPLVTSDAKHGDSIAVNGVCLTVVDVDGEVFTTDVMRETLQRSSLGALREGAPVNLERSATLASRMGGHLVQGHVDGVGTILAQVGGDYTFSLPRALAKYVVEKGSITVDGVSLTVTHVTEETFSVGLIPTTLKLTTLGAKGVGDPVNLEVDVVAKYVEKLLRSQS